MGDAAVWTDGASKQYQSSNEPATENEFQLFRSPPSSR